MAKRTFLVVLDSFGIGEAADADLFGDLGSNTLAAVCDVKGLKLPNLTQLGLFSIEGHKDPRILSDLEQTDPVTPIGSYGVWRKSPAAKTPR